MKKIKEHLPYLCMTLCELAIGILLLIQPVLFTRGIIICLGVLMTAVGIAESISYMREMPALAAKQQKLTKGLLLIFAGLFCIFQSEWFITTFPFLTILYGILLLCAGAYKIQCTADIRRLKKKNLVSSGISAALSLLFAVLLLWNPFGTGRAGWIVSGIFLIAESFLDWFILLANETAAAAFFRRKKKTPDSSDADQSEPPAPTGEN